MNTQLPEPGSVWIQLPQKAPMRVVYADETEIICHNCELMMLGPGTMHSWAGTPDAFAAAFREIALEHYPRTAGTEADPFL